LGYRPVQGITIGLEPVDHLAAHIAVAIVNDDGVKHRGGFDDDSVLLAKKLKKFGRFRKKAKRHTPSLASRGC
jgi:hypothetical protein